MAGYEVRGWEVVMAEVSRRRCSRALAGRVVKATPVGDGRVTFELPKRRAARDASSPSLPPAAASLVSVNPLHTTLEEIFVQQVARTASAREGALA